MPESASYRPEIKPYLPPQTFVESLDEELRHYSDCQSLRDTIRALDEHRYRGTPFAKYLRTVAADVGGVHAYRQGMPSEAGHLFSDPFYAGSILGLHAGAKIIPHENVIGMLVFSPYQPHVIDEYDDETVENMENWLGTLTDMWSDFDEDTMLVFTEAAATYGEGYESIDGSRKAVSLSDEQQEYFLHGMLYSYRMFNLLRNTTHPSTAGPI